VKKVIILFAAILMLVTAASAKESIPLYEDVPAECIADMKEELSYVIKAAEAMNISAIDSSQIGKDLSNVSLRGGYQYFYFSADYLTDNNSGLDFYEAIDRTMKERRLFILYVDENPTMLIIAAKSDDDEWYAERFGEDATEIIKALKTILRKDSEIYINGKVIFDRSGNTQRVVFAQEGKTDTIYKATDYMKYIKETSSYMIEKAKLYREELGIADDKEWVRHIPVGSSDGEDAPKFAAEPFIESENSFSQWYIIIIALLVSFTGLIIAILKKNKKSNAVC